ncbi:MAG TPA: molybdopterin-binding/glycosyltransferase family 2 protein [Dongiaceae bacterium]|nr:molybdopterin-binding/glycosyltransferase family 2 protein [Dongiaceae bacterium]
MIFGALPLDQCRDAILAHAVRVGDQLFKKGRHLSDSDLALLAAAGHGSVVVARLEAGDVGEDEAAAGLAQAIAGANIRVDPAFTGRANLFAESDGVLRLDPAVIDAVNEVDETITLATLDRYKPVMAGQMVATVKIIPFSVPQKMLDRVCAIAKASTHIDVAPFRPRRIGLIQTTLPTLKDSVLTKTTEVTVKRLAELNCSLMIERRCRHDAVELTRTIADCLAAGAELLLVLGASAITDRLDVIPAAIQASGGTVEQFGMPVDPGNLLLLASIAGKPIIGLPGCARSPKQNGVDWVLQRLIADLPVTARDIRHMGVGGLLGEILSRPQPRLGAVPQGQPANIGAVILAAGKSSRMGQNKLLLDVEGKPLICHVVDRALTLDLSEIVVVLGHQPEKVQQALAGRPVRFVMAKDYEIGMSASLKAGLAALSPALTAAFVLLGDMPMVSPALLRRMLAAYNPVEGRSIVLPVHGGKRGNPVLWDRRYFADMQNLAGDVGARHLIGEYAADVVEIASEDAGIFRDIDTPQSYAALQRGAAS